MSFHRKDVFSDFIAERRRIQDPLFGVRSMSDEEADDICSKFSGRLRALMRVSTLLLFKSSVPEFLDLLSVVES
jgi:hypothetical protein